MKRQFVKLRDVVNRGNHAKLSCNKLLDIYGTTVRSLTHRQECSVQLIAPQTVDVGQVYPTDKNAKTHSPKLGERIRVRHLCRIAKKLSGVEPKVLKAKLSEHGANSREYREEVSILQKMNVITSPAFVCLLLQITTATSPKLGEVSWLSMHCQERRCV